MRGELEEEMRAGSDVDDLLLLPAPCAVLSWSIGRGRVKETRERKKEREDSGEGTGRGARDIV